MAPSSIAKTAVFTPFGVWKFLQMPCGLKNATQSFQRLMDGVLRDVPFAFVFLDDILVASHSPQSTLNICNDFSPCCPPMGWSLIRLSVSLVLMNLIF
ncbi:Gag Pol polyprotein [Plakobranchus ocellatus]|uniref:Gag Pol polyprotein n=1 Tax=Plakobranchus ocellatus TaxID=259542 RepID=A0AAV3ZCV9_9GAST|nr:Gag Pol polyprotein [Plakobranchus ocellatus]